MRLAPISVAGSIHEASQDSPEDNTPDSIEGRMPFMPPAWMDRLDDSITRELGRGNYTYCLQGLKEKIHKTVRVTGQTLGID